MIIRSSLRALKARAKNCIVVTRGKRIYIINKKIKKFKARQGKQ